MDLILDFTETEILYTNKWFESELSDAIQKDYRHDNKLEFYSSVLDKLCRAKIVRHKNDAYCHERNFLVSGRRGRIVVLRNSEQVDEEWEASCS